MDPLVLTIMLLLVAGGAAAFIFMGMQSSRSTVKIEERLAQYADAPMSIEELELALPFGERVVAPFFLKLARSASRLGRA